MAVLGYELWQAHFEGDPSVIGRSLLVGNDAHTVVGVMPPGFAFPRNEEIWTALQTSPPRYERGTGPQLFVFGRLAPGATWDEAQAEIALLGRRAAADFPETNARLRPRVRSYTHALQGVRGVTLWEVAKIQLMLTLILVAIAANIAVLVYARTALRQGEIAVRTALGASRRRIVGQLFLEALLLSTLGAGLGLGVAHLALQRAEVYLGRDIVGFWVDYGLGPRSAAYALVLALLAAVIVGVVPGLMSTGRKLDTHLRRLNAGASVRLGWMWTVLIVLQVAMAITVLPTAVHFGVREITMAGTRATYPADEFLSAELAPAISLRPGMNREQYRRESAARFADRLPELERRVETEPAVAGVTFTGRLPGRDDLVEVEGVPGPAVSGTHRVASSGVAPDYFEVLGVRLLAGRSFRFSETGELGRSLVVGEAFERQILGEGTAIGRLVRFLPRPGPQQAAGEVNPGPWLEIVGVVEDLQASVLDAGRASPMAFYPVAPGELQSANLLIRVRNGDVDGFAPRLRQITAALDPELRLESLGNLATMRDAPVFAMMVSVLLLVLASVLLLSAAGIHALVSLAVTRRRREIAIRRALGGHALRLLATIFSRAAWQLGLGGLLGSLAGGALLLGSGRTGPDATIFLGGIVLLMLAAGLVAAVGPALRAIGIQPAEALREE